MFRHRATFDFLSLAPSQRRVLQPALEATDYRFSRIRARTGKRVPVSASDLSRFAQALNAHEDGHVHIHQDDEVGHLLGVPEAWLEHIAQGYVAAPWKGAATVPDTRAAPLGLYWLPTTRHPAGRIELDRGVFSNPDLAREVFLAEAAHAVDYGAMTEAQRTLILRAYADTSPDPDGVDDWFEEAGEQDYWSWIGESFMSGFMRAFAPSLPRPLEARQPWVHRSTDAIAARIREVLK